MRPSIFYTTGLTNFLLLGVQDFDTPDSVGMEKRCVGACLLIFKYYEFWAYAFALDSLATDISHPIHLLSRDAVII